MILATETGFRKSFKKLIKKNTQLQETILATIDLLGDDPFTPSLKSHKLTGQLNGLWSCTVNYNCRIIFAFRKDEETDDDLLVLIDIGSHDEVY
jgi:mRNA interferase YafQ